MFLGDQRHRAVVTFDHESAETGAA
jgi:hypothetical protein